MDAAARAQLKALSQTADDEGMRAYFSSMFFLSASLALAVATPAYAEEIALEARQHQLKTCFVSNGFMTPEAVERLSGWLDAANVDLKCFDDETYKKVIGGALQPFQAFGVVLFHAHAAGVHHADIDLGLGVSLGSGLTVPCHRLLEVPADTLT